VVRQIRIYFEGDPMLREGFEALFSEWKRRATSKQIKLRFVAARSDPERMYLKAVHSDPDSIHLVLRDSECADDGRLFENLCRRLDDSHRETVFWMVQLMEAWFLSDPSRVAEYYGTEEDKLRGNPDVEKIPKGDVLDRLDAVSRGSRKGKYSDHKARHGRDLLGWIRIGQVRNASGHCRRFCEKLEELV
jgi:hypothetical protein